MKNKISRYDFKDLMRPIKTKSFPGARRFLRFLKFIKKIYLYIVYLWHDHDWDYQYALDLLQFKLKRMAKEIKNNSIVADSQEIHDEIMYQSELMDRWKEEETEQAWNDMFEYMKKNMRRWWD